VPEGPECRVVADVISQLALNKEIAYATIVENVAGIGHRYSRKEPKNWGALTTPFWVRGVGTKGKLISLDISKDTSSEVTWVILVTLGMSGDFQHNALQHKHCRYAFKFNDPNDGNLCFIDPRCFGTIRIVTPQEANKLASKIGWDLLVAPMPDDAWHKLKLSSKLLSSQVGELLLEQKHFSGLGNIYRAETLYRAKINPRTPPMLLSKEQWKSVNQIGHKLLQEAYMLKGCSVADFTANGVEGRAQQLLQVYGKSNCPQGHPIEKIAQSDRTMWFCGQCQPYPVITN